MEIFLGVLIGIFCLLFLVTAHEFGHFLMARKNGVRVLEFGICFPPRAKAWVHEIQKDKDGKVLTKKNGKPLYKWIKIPKKDWNKPQKGLIFSLNLLPIGGFCQMDGESDADNRKGTFGAGTFWTKTKILFGGVLMNWIIAFLIFTVLAWLGMPTIIENQFTIESDQRIEYDPITVIDITPNSPADRAGFQIGDEILEINGEKVYTNTDVTNLGNQNAGKETEYKIQRASESFFCADSPDGGPYNGCHNLKEERILKVNLNEIDNEWGYILGIYMNSSTFVTNYYTWSAPIVGIGTTVQLTGETFKGLGGMVWNLISGAFSQFSTNNEVREAGKAAISAAGESVSGPIGIISMFIGLCSNPTFTLFLFGLISISLACMNVIPIPALDGGRWLMIFIARLKHKRLTKEKEEKIVAKALIVLFVLMILITILDIARFF